MNIVTTSLRAAYTGVGKIRFRIKSRELPGRVEKCHCSRAGRRRRRRRGRYGYGTAAFRRDSENRRARPSRAAELSAQPSPSFLARHRWRRPRRAHAEVNAAKTVSTRRRPTCSARRTRTALARPGRETRRWVAADVSSERFRWRAPRGPLSSGCIYLSDMILCYKIYIFLISL